MYDNVKLGVVFPKIGRANPPHTFRDHVMKCITGYKRMTILFAYLAVAAS
jgi:hypothetical protein